MRFLCTERNKGFWNERGEYDKNKKGEEPIKFILVLGAYKLKEMFIKEGYTDD